MSEPQGVKMSEQVKRYFTEMAIYPGQLPIESVRDSFVVLASDHDAAIDALRTQVAELRAQVVAQDRLIRKCGDWIEAARDDVIYPLASGTEHDVAIHEEAHGLGQTSATLIADIDAMIAATSAPEVQCKACNDTACDPSHEELVPCPGCAAKPAHVDDFHGDDTGLISSAKALLALDEKGALTDGGIGGHARAIIGAFIARMAEQGERQEAIPEIVCRRLLFAFGLECNTIGLMGAAENLHRGMKEAIAVHRQAQQEGEKG